MDLASFGLMLYLLTARVHIPSDHNGAVAVERRMRVVRLLVRFGIQLDQPVHVVQMFATAVHRARRVTVASVVADRAARPGFLVTAPRAAAAAGRHARAPVAGGQRALAYQRAGEAFPLPVPGND